MTTQPVGAARVLARRCHGVFRSAGGVEFVAHVDDPFAVHAALTTASCPAQVRTWPVSVMILSWVSAFTSLRSGTTADFPSLGGTRHAGQVSYEP